MKQQTMEIAYIIARILAGMTLLGICLFLLYCVDCLEKRMLKKAKEVAQSKNEFDKSTIHEQNQVANIPYNKLIGIFKKSKKRVDESANTTSIKNERIKL
jgi:hypothetical protein